MFQLSFIRFLEGLFIRLRQDRSSTGIRPRNLVFPKDRKDPEPWKGEFEPVWRRGV